MISQCRGLNYQSRLQSTTLLSLEDRRTGGDMIQVFKLMKGIDKVDHSNLFVVANSERTRGHRYKVIKSRSRLELRRNFFSQRIVNNWNELPDYVVEGDTVNTFKNSFDKFWMARLSSWR